MAGSELTLLTPHTGSVNGSGNNIFNFQNQSVVPEREMGVGGRYWLGYRNDSGLGVRTRYWHFNQLGVGPPNLDPNLDAQTWDTEVTQLFSRGVYSLDLSGGVRWGEINDHVSPVIDESFSGWGSTVALLGRRQIGSGPWSIIGGARGSLLFGNHDFAILGIPINSTQEVLPVMEMQLGGEYSKRMFKNTNTFLRSALETQLWEMPPTLIGLFDQNVGLVGVNFSAGIRY